MGGFWELPIEVKLQLEFYRYCELLDTCALQTVNIH